MKEKGNYQLQPPEVGMQTPEGQVQTVRMIDPGVYWVDTGAHGFLVLPTSHAQRTLTPPACRIGEQRGRWLFFEEDCALAAPLYEHPEWQSWLGWSQETTYEPEAVLRRYFPAYFAVPVQLELLEKTEQERNKGTFMYDKGTEDGQKRQ